MADGDGSTRGSGTTRRLGREGAWRAVLLLDALLTCSFAVLLGTWSTRNQIGPAEPGPVLPQPSDTLLVGTAVLLLASLAGTACAVLRRANRPETVKGGRAVSVLRPVVLLPLLLAFTG
ncbi:hypothetical protein [Streptomyces sp. NPDC048663]|uniref:hypothetical protein n=1 Tax=Streptomyces sp. NPDC048663 TaxID=3155638 RepID=UPI00343FF4F1